MREPHRLEQWIGADSEPAVRQRIEPETVVRRGLLVVAVASCLGAGAILGAAYVALTASTASIVETIGGVE